MPCQRGGQRPSNTFFMLLCFYAFMQKHPLALRHRDTDKCYSWPNRKQNDIVVVSRWVALSRISEMSRANVDTPGNSILC